MNFTGAGGGASDLPGGLLKLRRSLAGPRVSLSSLVHVDALGEATSAVSFLRFRQSFRIGAAVPKKDLHRSERRRDAVHSVF